MDIQEYISSGIVEAYVLGLADEAEVQEITHLRRQYAALDEAIKSFEQSLENQALEQKAAPPPHLRDSIWAAIEADKESESIPLPSAEAPVVPLAAPKPLAIVSRKWQMVAAAAFAGFLVCGGISIYYYNQYRQLAQDYAALQKEKTAEKLEFNNLYARVTRMQDPSVRKISLPGVKGHEQQLATVYYDTQSGEVFLFPVRLETPPPQQQYQLWAIVDGKPVDAGILDPDCTSFCQLKNIKDPQAFAITLEKEGGSPEPTLSAMVVMGGI